MSTSEDLASALPNLARFVERCERGSASKLFRETRRKLDELTGPKAAAAKKALLGLERAESVLLELYEVRLRLEDEARRAKSFRR